MIMIGARVTISPQQNRIGGPKFPGRTGTVVRRNSVAGEDFGGLWYVMLDATSRAKAREETFWGRDLRIIEGAKA